MITKLFFQKVQERLPRFARNDEAAVVVVVVVFLTLFLLPSVGLAYEVGTHQTLTEAAVELFNQQAIQPLDVDLVEVLVKGSVEEDNDLRFVNHFFDPVYDRGLTISSYSWVSAKQWAQDEKEQLAFGHRPFFDKVSNFFTASVSGSIDRELNFTWQAALRRYRDGDQEGAMLALGHVVHLLQDLTVPDHTRNDPHPFASPYENYAKYKQVNKQSIGDPVNLDNLNNYFDELADYTNKNFYSRDTIGLGKYSAPATDYFELKNNYYYGIASDEFGKYYLFRNAGKNLLVVNKDNLSIDTPVVLQGYWDRLSNKAVRYGAGLIGLFFREVEKIKIDSSALLQNDDTDLENRLPLRQPADRNDSGMNITGELLALISRANRVLDGLENNKDSSSTTQNDDEITNRNDDEAADGVGGVSSEIDDITTNSNNDSPAGTFIPIIPAGDVPDIDPPAAEVNNQDSSSATAVGTQNDNDAASDDEEIASSTTEVGTRNDNIIITEFLFDAEGADSGKEFIELYNPNNQEVDLSGWSIQTTGGKKNFEAGDKIGPKNFFLIWLGENANAGLEWKSGSLKNTSDTIYLVRNYDRIDDDNDADIVDKVTYNIENLVNFQPGYSLERIVNGDGTVATSFKVQTQPSPGTVGQAATLAAETVVVENQTIVAEETVPQEAFFDYLNYYRDPNNSQRYIVDIKFKQFPFLPAGWSDPWKILVFYKDRQPTAQEVISTSDDWTPASNGLLSVVYPIYEGNAARRSLILPTSASGSGNAGGIMNRAYNFNVVEDKIVRFYTTEIADYLTVAIYDFYSSGGGQQNFILKTIDDINYPYLNSTPDYLAPVLGGQLSFSFDRTNSLLTLNWSKATDGDSRDVILTYEVNISGEVSDLSANNFQVNVAPGDQITASVRAKDEFGNYSTALTGEWQYPAPVMVLKQNLADGWSSYVGSKNQNCPTCPGTASLQSLVFNQTTSFDFVNLKIWQSGGGWAAGMRLGVYADTDNNYPDFNGRLATTSLAPRVDDNADDVTTFTFNSPLTLEKGKKYWLVLDVDDYTDGRAFYRNRIQNAVYSAADSYGGGIAGAGHGGDCSDYCFIHVPYPSASADWWMEMGLTQ